MIEIFLAYVVGCFLITLALAVFAARPSPNERRRLRAERRIARAARRER